MPSGPTRVRQGVQRPRTLRISAITAELEPTGLFEKLPVKEYPLKHILAVHDAGRVGRIREDDHRGAGKCGGQRV